MAGIVSIVLFGLFFGLMFLGLPVVFAIGVSGAIAGLINFSSSFTSIIAAQQIIGGLSKFGLLAIVFFILAGTIMNQGGIARRLIALAELLVGRLPGSLAHCTVVANMLFGSISGSAVAACAAVGGIMAPTQRKAGYDEGYSAAVNIASAPVGLLIPPSSSFIIYSLISGGTSISALFLAGYIPGILMSFAIMLVAGVIAARRGYGVRSAEADKTMSLKNKLQVVLEALPALALMIVVVFGIIGGYFTATEGSAVAVFYTLILSLVFYRSISLRQLIPIFVSATVTSSIVLSLIAFSGFMSWIMAVNHIPTIISESLLSLTNNKYIIFLLIDVILLTVGMFMDITPAMLIFTPIFLPIVSSLGMGHIQFGVLLTVAFCIGICTPPVGSCLFVGSSVAEIPVTRALPTLVKLYVPQILILILVTYWTSLSTFLPDLFLGS